MYKKEFDKWNTLKVRTSSFDHVPPFVKEGQIWWCTLGVNIGYEIDGKGDSFVRPVIIVRKLSREMFLICPLTTSEKVGSWFIKISQAGVISYACIHQIKIIDYRRMRDMKGSLDENDFAKVSEAISNLYKINSARPEVGQPWEIPKYKNIITNQNYKSSENFDKNIKTVKLPVPYHSQFLEVEDHFWNIRSCGGTCIKMILDYYSQENRIEKEYKAGIAATSILEIMNEARSNRGYDINNGFVHDFAVNYFKKYGLISYRKEISKLFTFSESVFEEKKKEFLEEIIKSIDNDNPVIVSITKHTLEQNKFHLILLAGYKYIEENAEEKEGFINTKVGNKKITHIIYHEPESTSPERGAYRECDIEIFLKDWRGKVIFVSK